MPQQPWALTFDVEDWFQVRNMRAHVSYESWADQELRVTSGLDFILAALEAKNLRATFFVLGWLAERHPELVERILAGGHEVASHGYSHTPLDLMTPATFRQDLARSLTCLRGITGQEIQGFRAPSFSITRKTWWAFQILADAGIAYDSSVFPVRHPDYGVVDFPQAISHHNGVQELPLPVATIAGLRIPVAGGGYFRLLPYQVSRRLMQRVPPLAPRILYFHPWEFDPGQPRRKLGFSKTLRHYSGLRANRRKFLRLLEDVSFTTLGAMRQEATL